MTYSSVDGGNLSDDDAKEIIISSLKKIKSFNTFDKYVLVNDDSVTWDDIWNSTIGIAEGFWHEEVYNKYDYKDGADPEKVTTVDIDF